MATCLDDGLQTVYASVERQSACEIASNPRVFLRVRHLMVVLSLEKKRCHERIHLRGEESVY